MDPAWPEEKDSHRNDMHGFILTFVFERRY